MSIKKMIDFYFLIWHFKYQNIIEICDLKIFECKIKLFFFIWVCESNIFIFKLDMKILFILTPSILMNFFPLYIIS